MESIPEAELARVEAAIGTALDTDDHGGLSILGYGEISVTVGWPAGGPRWACKRLPPFPDHPAAIRYGALVREYVTRLRALGVGVVDTDVRFLDRPDGRVVVHLVQPVLEPATLGPAVLAAADPATGHPLVGSIVAATVAGSDGTIGVDAQLTNWAWVDGRALNVDVTTPFLYDPAGRPRLDLDLFLGALPWVVRASQRRAAPRIVARWSSARWALTDLAMNLYKDDLAAWIPAVAEAADAHLDESLDVDGLRRRYDAEAALWVRLDRLKRIDRWWQRRVRRRRYEFLVPPSTAYRRRVTDA